MAKIKRWRNRGSRRACRSTFCCSRIFWEFPSCLLFPRLRDKIQCLNLLKYPRCRGNKKSTWNFRKSKAQKFALRRRRCWKGRKRARKSWGLKLWSSIVEPLARKVSKLRFFIFLWGFFYKKKRIYLAIFPAKIYRRLLFFGFFAAFEFECFGPLREGL